MSMKPILKLPIVHAGAALLALLLSAASVLADYPAIGVPARYGLRSEAPAIAAQAEDMGYSQGGLGLVNGPLQGDILSAPFKPVLNGQELVEGILQDPAVGGYVDSLTDVLLKQKAELSKFKGQPYGAPTAADLKEWRSRLKSEFYPSIELVKPKGSEKVQLQLSFQNTSNFKEFDGLEREPALVIESVLASPKETRKKILAAFHRRAIAMSTAAAHFQAKLAEEGPVMLREVYLKEGAKASASISEELGTLPAGTIVISEAAQAQ
jgi:hypothetical protein